MKRIIIHGLKPEYHGIITATRGWDREPTLTELENILINQEMLDKQMSKVSIKDDEKALFSGRRRFNRKDKAVTKHGPEDNKFTQRQGSWQRRPGESSQRGGA